MDRELPPLVVTARARAEAAGFLLSCTPEVGWLLAAIAASVARGGRILELGTGVGVGLAWMDHGLGTRSDVEIVSVDIDQQIQESARQLDWHVPVQFLVGDAAELVSGLGQFEMIFADAPGGKIFKLRRTIGAMAPGGILIVDDMDLTKHDDPDLRSGLTVVRERLMSSNELVCSELPFSTGVILAVKMHSVGRGGGI
jgi:predicted O-methyltransferase YrrM